MRAHRMAALVAVLVVAIGAAAFGAASAITSNPTAVKAAAGAITIALGSEPTTLDPLLKDDGNERNVTGSIYETLLGRSTDGKTLYPKLAAAMPKLINATTWRFKLRPGITFTDGEPLNADAVVASVKRIIDPKYNSEQVGFVSTFKDARKVDDLTVDIITTGPDPILPSRMYWLRIIPPLASQKPGFDANPVGTGPYKLVEWVRGDHITLAANPNYWGAPKASIATVTFKFVPEEGAQLAGLLSGEFDVITNLLPDDAHRAPKFMALSGLEHPVLILNARPGSGITSDVRVRQAMNYAVDKNAIAKKLYLGYATVDTGQLMSASWFGYDPKLKAYPYDPKKAKQLLKQAGAIGKTINIVGESGRWLKDRETIEAVSQFWRAVGLKVNVQIYAFNEYLNRLFDKKVRPQVVYVSNSNELYDADRTLSTYYESSGIGASNSDALVQKLTDRARTETNVAKRLALYHQVIDRVRQKAYFVWLINNKTLWGTSKRLVWQPRQDAFIYLNTMSVK